MRAILTYHSIDESGSAISVSPEAFTTHTRWLASGSVRVLPLDDLLTHSDAGQDAVAVTFDDAFLNTRGPVRDSVDRGVPVTLFVVTGHVGGTNAWGGRPAAGIPTLPLLGWDDLAELATRGTTIAAHTRTHASLTGLSRDGLDEELLGARDDLETRLGTRTAHVAYPYGDINDEVTARAAQFYRWGHTTAFRILHGADAPLQLPRLDMYYFQAPGALEAWGTPRFRRRLAWCRARRSLRARIFGAHSRSARTMASAQDPRWTE